MFAALVVLVACHSAKAQDDIKPPNLEIPKSGVAQAFPADAAVPSGAADARLFSSIASEEALATQFKEAIPHTRGPQDISLFREDCALGGADTCKRRTRFWLSASRQ